MKINFSKLKNRIDLSLTHFKKFNKCSLYFIPFRTIPYLVTDRGIYLLEEIANPEDSIIKKVFFSMFPITKYWMKRLKMQVPSDAVIRVGHRVKLFSRQENIVVNIFKKRDRNLFVNELRAFRLFKNKIPLPKLLLVDKREMFIITSYIEGSPIKFQNLTFRLSLNLQEIFSKIHKSSEQVTTNLRNLPKLIRGVKVSTSTFRRFVNLFNLSTNSKVRVVLSHNDTCPSNFLVTENKEVVLLDFEHMGYNVIPFDEIMFIVHFLIYINPKKWKKSAHKYAKFMFSHYTSEEIYSAIALLMSLLDHSRLKYEKILNKIDVILDGLNLY